MHARRPFQILSITLILSFLMLLTGSAQAARGVPARARRPLQTGSSVQAGSLSWNTFLGGDGNDWGNGIALDAEGNAYITGESPGTWGDPVNPYAGGPSDAFVAKVDSTGALIWNTFLGGNPSYTRGNTIALDAKGNIYITGPSNGTWGDPINPYAGRGDAFVAKLDSSGALIWNTFLGGSSNDNAVGIAVDGSGNVSVIGSSQASWGSPVNPSAGNEDAFVARLDANGSLAWNTFLGGAFDDSGTGIAVDGQGNSYITGDGPDSWGSPLNAFPGGMAAFVAKLDGNGALTWNTFLGGSKITLGDGIALDAAGNIYVTGGSHDTWGSPVDAFDGCGDLLDCTNAFVARLDGNGALAWNTFVGGRMTERGNDIALGADGNAYIVGISHATWGTPVRPFAGSTDAFVARVDSTGALAWNTFLGGTSNDYGSSIAVDGHGNIYTVGQSCSTWGDPIRPVYGQLECDAFVAKLNSAGVFPKSTIQYPTQPAHIEPTRSPTPLKTQTAPVEPTLSPIPLQTQAAPVKPLPSPIPLQTQAAPVEPARSPMPTHVGSLIQDGSLVWNTFLGSSSQDSAKGIALDADGNIYITGTSASTWGDPINAYAGGKFDAFVAKLDSNGTLIWNTFLGSTANDSAWAVAIDPKGYIYVAGASFASWGSPIHPFGDGEVAGFVAKLDPSGTLLWNTFPGSGSANFAQGIAVDGSGKVFVTGISSASWGNPVNAFSGRENAYVARLDSNGSLVWNTFLPSDSGIGFDIALDASGNSYIAGQGENTGGSTQNPSRAVAFVAKLDNSGALMWNTFLAARSGYMGTTAEGIAVDGAGNSYITGSDGGGPQAFVAKLDGTGALVWNTFFEGNSWGQDIALDSDANAYITGFDKGTWGAPVRPFAGGTDAFVAEVDHNGALAWNTFLGGAREDMGLGIAVDRRGNVYTAGKSSSTWGSQLRPFSSQSAPDASFSIAFVAKLLGNDRLQNAGPPSAGSQKAGLQNAGPPSAGPQNAGLQDAGLRWAVVVKQTVLPILGLWIILGLITAAIAGIASRHIEHRSLGRLEILLSGPAWPYFLIALILRISSHRE